MIKHYRDKKALTALTAAGVVGTILPIVATLASSSTAEPVGIKDQKSMTMLEIGANGGNDIKATSDSQESHTKAQTVGQLIHTITAEKIIQVPKDAQRLTEACLRGLQPHLFPKPEAFLHRKLLTGDETDFTRKVGRFYGLSLDHITHFCADVHTKMTKNFSLIVKEIPQDRKNPNPALAKLEEFMVKHTPDPMEQKIIKGTVTVDDFKGRMQPHAAKLVQDIKTTIQSNLSSIDEEYKDYFFKVILKQIVNHIGQQAYLSMNDERNKTDGIEYNIMDLKNLIAGSLYIREPGEDSVTELSDKCTFFPFDVVKIYLENQVASIILQDPDLTRHLEPEQKQSLQSVVAAVAKFTPHTKLITALKYVSIGRYFVSCVEGVHHSQHLTAI